MYIFPVIQIKSIVLNIRKVSPFFLLLKFVCTQNDYDFLFVCSGLSVFLPAMCFRGHIWITANCDCLVNIPSIYAVGKKILFKKKLLFTGEIMQQFQYVFALK